MKRLTPQEKKQLSYERDRRNAYGQNDKASRKAIPLRKRLISRAYRRNTQQLLPKNELGLDQDRLESADVSVATVRRPGWRKSPDMPLGEWVVHQREKRERLTGRKALSKARPYAQQAISSAARHAGFAEDIYLFIRDERITVDGQERHRVRVSLVHAQTMARAEESYSVVAPAPVSEHLKRMLEAAGRALPALEARIAECAADGGT